METNLPALMARIQEIRTRMQEIQGMAARGGPPGGPAVPDATVPPADPTAGPGGSPSSADADFSALLGRALDALGRGSGPTGGEDVNGAVDLMSSALSSLSSLTESGEETDVLMSRESLSRLTDIERVLRGTLDSSSSGE